MRRKYGPQLFGPSGRDIFEAGILQTADLRRNRFVAIVSALSGFAEAAYVAVVPGVENGAERQWNLTALLGEFLLFGPPLERRQIFGIAIGAVFVAVDEGAAVGKPFVAACEE